MPFRTKDCGSSWEIPHRRTKKDDEEVDDKADCKLLVSYLLSEPRQQSLLLDFLPCWAKLGGLGLFRRNIRKEGTGRQCGAPMCVKAEGGGTVV